MSTPTTIIIENTDIQLLKEQLDDLFIIRDIVINETKINIQNKLIDSIDGIINFIEYVMDRAEGYQ